MTNTIIKAAPMRIAAALLALATATAQAEIVAIIPMDSGAGLRLTNDACPGKEGQLFAYLRQTNSQVVTGCWTYSQEEGAVLVVYDAGGMFLYDLKDAILPAGEDKPKVGL